MELFNNREVATLIWLLAFSFIALSSSSIRRSALQVIRAILRWEILFALGLMALYTTVLVAALRAAGLWNVALLKDTVLWFCFAGIVTAFDFVTSRAKDDVFLKILIDNLKVVLLLEFLVNTYTLSLLGELVLVPVLTIIVTLDAVAKTDPKYAAVSKLLTVLLVVIGFTFLTFAVVEAISDYKNLQNWDTARSLLLAPALSILLSPFIYVLLLVTNYEVLFYKLDIGTKKEASLKRYAKRRMLAHLRCSVRRLRAFLRAHSLKLSGIRTRADLDEILQSLVQGDDQSGEGS